MSLDKSHSYVFRIGSDNQHRVHWDGQAWQYEFLAGGVLFDQLTCMSEEELEGVVSVHGLTLDRFSVDQSNDSAVYSKEIRDKMSELVEAGIDPCPKHGLMAKNKDGSCEACQHTDYFDDFKGTEG
jgi:hypothetical protein